MRAIILITGILESLCSIRSNSFDSTATVDLYRARTESIETSDDNIFLRRSDSTNSVDTVVLHYAAAEEAEEIHEAAEKKFHIVHYDIECEPVVFDEAPIDS
jgi:hypothetical protein